MSENRANAESRENAQLVAETDDALEAIYADRDGDLLIADLLARLSARVEELALAQVEHDALVRREALKEAADIAARMYAGTDGPDYVKEWIGGCQATERRIRELIGVGSVVGEDN
jgi:hypothetical protein